MSNISQTMVNRSIVGPKGQITLPKSLREKYHVLEGEEVILVPQEEGILVKHKPSTLRAMFRGKIDLKGFEEDIKQIHKEWRI